MLFMSFILLFHGVLYLICLFSYFFIELLVSKIFLIWELASDRLEVYSEPNQISKMELFVKIVNGFQLLLIFVKGFHIRCLTGFWIRVWIQLAFTCNRNIEQGVKYV